MNFCYYCKIGLKLMSLVSNEVMHFYFFSRCHVEFNEAVFFCCICSLQYIYIDSVAEKVRAKLLGCHIKITYFSIISR